MPRPRLYTADIDQRFGRWIVLETEIRRQPTNSQRKKHEPGFRVALVECDCGQRKLVRIDVLCKGLSTSCGCYASQVASGLAHQLNVSHGLTLTPVTHELHSLWVGIVKRTTDTDAPSWRSYGGRGITLCERWKDPSQFVADVLYEIGARPEGMEIDRIDNDRGYEPGNIRWANRTTQNRNRRPWSEWKKHEPNCRCCGCVNRAKGVAARVGAS